MIYPATPYLENNNNIHERIRLTVSKSVPTNTCRLRVTLMGVVFLCTFVRWLQHPLCCVVCCVSHYKFVTREKTQGKLQLFTFFSTSREVIHLVVSVTVGAHISTHTRHWTRLVLLHFFPPERAEQIETFSSSCPLSCDCYGSSNGMRPAACPDATSSLPRVNASSITKPSTPENEVEISRCIVRFYKIGISLFALMCRLRVYTARTHTNSLCSLQVSWPT